MGQYIRKIPHIRHTGAFLATGGKAGKTHNVTAPNLDGVFKDKNGNIYQIQGNLIRYMDNTTGRWGDWMLNPKFEDGFSATGKKKKFTAMEFAGSFPDFFAPKQPKGWPFTGDTGGILNWQIGFEDPPYFGLFGSKRKKEASAVSDAMADARRDHPAVRTCAEAEAGIRSVRAHIESTQRSIDDGSTSSSVGPRYLAAYNTILAEYTSFYNNNCLITIPDPTVIPLDTGMLQDPILATTLPSVPLTPSQVAAAQQQAATSAQAQTNAGATTANSGTAKPFAVPKWALYTGAGLAVATILALILKKKKA